METFEEFKADFEKVDELKEEWYDVDAEDPEFLGYIHFENEEELKAHYDECIANDFGFDMFAFSYMFTDGKSFTIFHD